MTETVKMFIANCTSQNQDFTYRLPKSPLSEGTPGPRIQQIGIGRQIQISGELTAPDIEAILKQHARYGLIHVSEIDRTRPFTGMCWSEKPISVEKVKRLWMHNQGVLADRGRAQRQAAAISAHEQIEEQNPGALKALELSVEEVPTEGKPDTDFAEGTRVTRDPS